MSPSLTLKQRDYLSMVDFPTDLRQILYSTDALLNELYFQLYQNKITLGQFREAMQEVLSRGIGTAFMLGANTTEPNSLQQNFIARETGKQFDFLGGMVAAIALAVLHPKKTVLPDGSEVTENPIGRFQNRIRSYADSLVYAYRSGEYWGIPLPAIPGDGTTQCLTHCKCHWDIQVIDEANGDWDCYWRLGVAEHCQTCIERDRDWLPLRIRNFEIINPYQITRIAEHKEQIDFIVNFINAAMKGGKGSGHFGHAGRPGKVGGSLPAGGLKTIDHFPVVGKSQILEGRAVYYDGEFYVLNNEAQKDTNRLHLQILSRIALLNWDKFSPEVQQKIKDDIESDVLDDSMLEDIIMQETNSWTIEIQMGRTVVVKGMDDLPTSHDFMQIIRKLQDLTYEGKIAPDDLYVQVGVASTKIAKDLLPQIENVTILGDEVFLSFYGEMKEIVTRALEIALKGGKGSGHFGHAGRPGEVGGSLPAGAGGAPDLASEPIHKIVYHGSNNKFDKFETGREMKRVWGGLMGSGERTITTEAIYFSNTEIGAKFFGEDRYRGLRRGTPYLYEVEMDLKHPLDLTQADPEQLALLQEAGFDFEPYMLNKNLTDIDRKFSMDYGGGDNIVGFHADDLWQALETPGVVSYLKKLGYDGAIIYEPGIPTDLDEGYDPVLHASPSEITYAVFSPESIKIKSVTEFEPDYYKELKAIIRHSFETALKGGKGSGHFGHAGRPGLVGGSQPAGAGGGKIGESQEPYEFSSEEIDRNILGVTSYSRFLELAENDGSDGNPIEEQISFITPSGNVVVTYPHVLVLDELFRNLRVKFEPSDPMGKHLYRTGLMRLMHPIDNGGGIEISQKGITSMQLSTLGKILKNLHISTLSIPIYIDTPEGWLKETVYGFSDLRKKIALKGGKGSGHFGHAGRPGLVGGSQPAGAGGGKIGENSRLYGNMTQGNKTLQEIIEPFERSYIEYLDSPDFIYEPESIMRWASMSVEQSMIMDDNGFVLRQGGTATQIVYSDNDINKIEGRANQNTRSAHNHPSEPQEELTRFPACLSDSDIQFALVRGIRETTAFNKFGYSRFTSNLPQNASILGMGEFSDLYLKMRKNKQLIDQNATRLWVEKHEGWSELDKGKFEDAVTFAWLVSYAHDVSDYGSIEFNFFGGEKPVFWGFYNRYYDKLFEGVTLKGGKGSGHFGHAGRPGKVGGSLPAGAGGGKIGENSPITKPVQGKIDAAKLGLQTQGIEQFAPFVAHRANDPGDQGELIALWAMSDYENQVTLDEDGKVFMEKSGTEKYVHFEKEELRKLALSRKELRMLHNHPWAGQQKASKVYPGLSSLSIEDVSFAAQNGLKSITAFNEFGYQQIEFLIPKNERKQMKKEIVKAEIEFSSVIDSIGQTYWQKFQSHGFPKDILERMAYKMNIVDGILRNRILEKQFEGKIKFTEVWFDSGEPPYIKEVLHDVWEKDPVLQAIYFGSTTKGGKGSGHFGHAGRPGEVGGSLPAGAGGGKIGENNPHMEGENLTYVQRSKQDFYRCVGAINPTDNELVFETWINQNKEQMRVTDASTGRLLFVVHGDETRIRIPAENNLEMRNHPNPTTLAHNHPNPTDSTGIIGLSVNDIASCYMNKVEEIISLDKNGYSRMFTRRNQQGGYSKATHNKLWGELAYAHNLVSMKFHNYYTKNGIKKGSQEYYEISNGASVVALKKFAKVMKNRGYQFEYGYWNEGVPENKYIEIIESERIAPDLFSGSTTKGGKGSGHFGHAGRPGEVGGSLPAGAGGGKIGDEPGSFPHNDDLSYVPRDMSFFNDFIVDQDNAETELKRWAGAKIEGIIARNEDGIFINTTGEENHVTMTDKQVKQLEEGGIVKVLHNHPSSNKADELSHLSADDIMMAIQCSIEDLSAFNNVGYARIYRENSNEDAPILDPIRMKFMYDTFEHAQKRIKEAGMLVNLADFGIVGVEEGTKDYYALLGGISMLTAEVYSVLLQNYGYKYEYGYWDNKHNELCDKYYEKVRRIYFERIKASWEN